MEQVSELLLNRENLALSLAQFYDEAKQFGMCKESYPEDFYFLKPELLRDLEWCVGVVVR